MPKRKNPPRLRFVVEYEMTSPEPASITKDMVDSALAHVRRAIRINVPKVVDCEREGQEMRLRYRTTTKVVK